MDLQEPDEDDDGFEPAAQSTGGDAEQAEPLAQHLPEGARQSTAEAEAGAAGTSGEGSEDPTVAAASQPSHVDGKAEVEGDHDEEMCQEDQLTTQGERREGEREEGDGERAMEDINDGEGERGEEELKFKVRGHGQGQMSNAKVTAIRRGQSSRSRVKVKCQNVKIMDF